MLSKQLENFIDKIGKATSYLAVFMVLVQFTVVLIRYFFDLGFIQLQESILYMHGFLFLFGMAYTLQKDEHVRVDIFYRSLKEKYKNIIDCLGIAFILLPFCLFVEISSWQYVYNSWSILEGSRETSGLPFLFILKTSLIIFPLLVMIQGIALLLKITFKMRSVR